MTKRKDETGDWLSDSEDDWPKSKDEIRQWISDREKELELLNKPIEWGKPDDDEVAAANKYISEILYNLQLADVAVRTRFALAVSGTILDMYKRRQSQYEKELIDAQEVSQRLLFGRTLTPSEARRMGFEQLRWP